ncbi:MAG TPA: hypothetical protein VIM56_04575 [Rhizomicrobium sp.]
MHLLRKASIAGLALAAAAAMATGARAEDAYDGHWHFSVMPYLWAPGYEGHFRYNIPPGASGTPNVNVGPIDAFKLLNFAFMGTAEVNKGRWGLFTDIVYVNFDNDKARVKSITGAGGDVEFPVNLGTEAGLKATVWTLAPSYAFYANGASSSAVFLGTRYLDVTSSLTWNFSGPLALFPQSGKLEQKANAWDAIGGIKGRFGFSGSHWFIDYYADIGTGDTDLTYQGVAAVGYSWGCADFELAYRYLHYEPGERRFIKNLSFYGPALGVRFHF